MSTIKLCLRCLYIEITCKISVKKNDHKKKEPQPLDKVIHFRAY